MDNFDEFKKKLDAFDQQTWNDLKTTLTLIVLNWCRKEYLEPSWVVLDGKLINENEFANHVYNAFKIKYCKVCGSINNFTSLKFYLIEITKEQLFSGFGEFFINIKNRDNNSWKLFDTRIRPILKAWLIKKGETSLELFEKIYSETIYVFFEKLQKMNLKFNDSRHLKSYMIRISEYKLKEYRHKGLTADFINIEDSSFYDIPVLQSIQIEMTQKKEQLKDLLNILSPEEKKIIYGVFFLEMKIKDIAGILKVSEETCRVKKYRALKKLQEQIVTVPYFNDPL